MSCGSFRPLLFSSSRLFVCSPSHNFSQLSRPFFNKHKKYRPITISSQSKESSTTDGDSFVPVPTPMELLVRNFPKSMQPYMTTMRLHSPAGGWLLFFPGFFALTLNSTPGAFFHPSYMWYFGVGTILMRGVGCTINDLVDRKNDLLVERTQNRPIATGELSLPKALTFLAAQSSLSLYILSRFDINSIILGLSSLGLVCLYPFAKKFTYWPQLLLGFTFNWGVLLGWSVMNNGSLNNLAVIPLYLACVSWTLIYDTIYAHQDRVHDVNIGIKSTAIKFGDQTHTWLKIFSVSMIANLALEGYLLNSLWPYWVGLLGASYQLHSIISTLDINDPKNCEEKFTENVVVGWILLVGMILSRLVMTSVKEPMEHNMDKAAMEYTKELRETSSDEKN